MRELLREIKYFLWALYGFIGLKAHSFELQKANVLITYYNPARMKHINHQIRNIFKCAFVEKIIISNHNPKIDIASFIKIKDERVTIINQNTRKGCGHRWLVAHEYLPQYLIVMDDDILIFPWQLKKLFDSLVAEPAIPHGLAGMIHHQNDFLEYREMEEQVVDYICEIYAITGEHLIRYIELRNEISKDDAMTTMVEFSADFIIVSRTGHGKPKIHKTGRLFRCPSYNENGVAVHKDTAFNTNIITISSTLNDLVTQSEGQQVGCTFQE